MAESEGRSWLTPLEKRLSARLPRIERYEAYYDGHHRLAFATSKFRETFGSLFRAFADNWCDLVVDASVERLRVEGFRFGEDEQGDADAWELWQRNGLDADSKLAHVEAVKCEESYLIVGPGEEHPLITVEHPSQVIVMNRPDAPRVRAAALKKWIDDDEHAMATVYLPRELHKYRSNKPVNDEKRIVWNHRESVPNPLGVVPVVPLRNNPTLLGGGQSDIAKVIPLQDAVNKLVTDMIVASEFQAFRQRWATGIEIPTDPDTGQQLDREKFLSSVSRMWTTGDEGVKFGEFAASDPSPYVKAIEMLIQHIAAQTRTPPHYLLGQSGAFPSGESLKATETGLVAKVRAKQVDFGEGYEEAMRLAFLLKGDTTKGRAYAAETLWKNPESRTEAETMDAAVKMKSLAVPYPDIWAYMGHTPQQIARFKKELPRIRAAAGESDDPSATDEVDPQAEVAA